MVELQSYFRQGISYLVNIYTSHYDSLIKFRYYNSEIVLALEVLVQLYYLKFKNSTYSEYFFNFKRSGFDKANHRFQMLPKYSLAIMIFFETILPYLK
jgi:Pex2 / Pex12 amino terminal region